MPKESSKYIRQEANDSATAAEENHDFTFLVGWFTPS